MHSIHSRIRQLEARAVEGESGLLVQTWSVGANGRASTVLRGQEHVQAAGESVEDFQRRVTASMTPRRAVVWITEQEVAL